MGVVVECGLLRSVPEFVVGVLLYRLRELAPAKHPARLVNIAAAALCALFIGLALFHTATGLWLSVPLMALLVYGLSYQRGQIACWLSQPTWQFLGTISFSFYMVHYIVLQTGFTLVPIDDLARMPELYGVAYIVLLWAETFLLAWGCYSYVENPTRGWLLSKARGVPTAGL